MSRERSEIGEVGEGYLVVREKGSELGKVMSMQDVRVHDDHYFC